MSDGVVSGMCAAPAVVLPPNDTSRDTVISGSQGSGKKQPAFQRHYNELLQVISEIGKDVKPAYTSNKLATDKLRKNIMLARTVLRDCQADLEKLGTTAQE